jgi:tRNA threonylcarbamoyl adenosine modification protein YeaZ
VLILFKFIPKDLLVDNNSSINTDIMNFLSIDCSTEIGSLFAKVENKTFSKVLQNDKFVNDLMAKYILDFIEENHLKFEDLGQIFVNQGPGSFSGLRSSLAIAKGISLSKNIKLYGYDTFMWSSAKFYNKNDIIISLIRIREKYFIKKFDKKLNVVLKPKEISEEELIENYHSEFKVIPKNISKQINEKVLKLKNLIIVDLNHKELEFLHLQGLLNKDLIKPIYLS